ncbi:hypothetical protein [Dysgonomonas mossii]|uniref:hypothetical protein n=1 Tax=Dysgonomonas mossii TaxID=163665 RepID=UPI003992AE37
MSKLISYDQAVSFKAFGYMGKTYSYFLELGKRQTGRKKIDYNSKACHYAAPLVTDALNYLRDRLGMYCGVAPVMSSECQPCYVGVILHFGAIQIKTKVYEYFVDAEFELLDSVIKYVYELEI